MPNQLNHTGEDEGHLFSCCDTRPSQSEPNILCADLLSCLSPLQWNCKFPKDLDLSFFFFSYFQPFVQCPTNRRCSINVLGNISFIFNSEKIVKLLWFIALDNFCNLLNSLKIKENQQYGKTYLPMIPQTRAWSPKYIKNSHDCTPGRQTSQLKNGQRTWTDTSPRKTYRGPRDIWKNAQHH